MSNPEIDAFVANCMRLEFFIKQHTRDFSDREILSVMVSLITQLVKAQDDPKASLKQVLRSISLLCDEPETIPVD